MQAARAATGFRTVNTPLAFGVSTPTRLLFKGSSDQDHRRNNELVPPFSLLADCAKT